MKNLCFILGLSLVLFSCQKNPSYTNEDGGFSIDFPSAPTITIDSFNTQLGKVVKYSFMVESSLSNAQMVVYSDYPVSAQYIKDPYKFIDGAKEGALRSLGIDDVIVDKRIELDGVPGIEVIGQNGQELLIHYKLFLKANRLYQIGLLKGLEMEETPEELEFIKSFVLL
jgi:hypothetical protein